MKRSFGLLLTLLVLAAAAPVAAAEAPITALSAIAADKEAGLIDAHTARMQGFYSVFRPDLLAADYATLDRSDSPRCATDLVTEMRVHWDQMSPIEQHVVADATSPIYRSWVEQGGVSWIDGNPDAAMAEERSTCMAPEDALNGAGPYGGRLDTEHFAIFHNIGGVVTETKIEWLADWFEDALTIEHEQMGFYMPSNMFQYQLIVMVENLGSPYTGGFTSIAQCGVAGYMAYVVVNSQWFDDTGRLQSVAAHELFHAIQMEYAFEELFYGESRNRWWVEASAVFMETEVFDDLYNSQLSQGYRWYSEPWRSLETHDDTGFQYGTYLLAASARQSFDEADWFHELWDQIEGRTNYHLIDEFDELWSAEGRDSSFAQEWGRFIARAATGDFDFNPYMQLEDGYIEVTVVADHDEDDLPLDERVNNDSNLDRPEYLGVNYVWIDSSGVPDNYGLIIGFDGNGQKSGEDLAWEVQLVAVEDDEEKHTHDLDLEAIYDSDDDLDAWVGEILLNDFGEDFDGVYIAVSPTSDYGDGVATWGYTARLTESTADGGFDPVPEEDEGDDDDDDGGQGCRQSSASVASQAQPGALVLLTLFGVAITAGRIRRRR
jgi:hypothetical protein